MAKPTRVDLYFSEPDARAIEDAVTRAEATTSGELAVEVVDHVGHWRTNELVGLVVGFLIAAAVSLWWSQQNGWGMYYNFSSGFFWGCVGAATGYLLARFVIGSRTHRIAAVWQTGVARFQQLPPTKGETAVLVFLSLYERHAVLVADQKIAEKVAQGEWDKLQQELTDAIAAGQHSEGIIRCVSHLGTLLAHHFPKQGDDSNELPNRPTLG